MSNFVTHQELDLAIADVTSRIDEIEEQLGDHLDGRLDRQDDRLDAIYAWLVAGLFIIMASLVGVIAVLLTHQAR